MRESFLWYREERDQESLVHSIMNGFRSAKPYTVPGRTFAPHVSRVILWDTGPGARS
jgi:hypothetical protein